MHVPGSEAIQRVERYGFLMRVPPTRLTIWSLLVCGSMLVSGPARADVLSGADEAGDVVFYDVTNGVDEALPGTTVPARRYPDLTRYTVRHGAQRIRVRMKFRDLRRREPVLVFSARFRWPESGALQYAEAVVTARPGNRAGRARLTINSGCAVSHRISYARNQVRVSFAATCFGSPRWVQFNALILTADGLKRPSYVYADDVFPVFSAPGEVERYSKRIHKS